MELLCTIMHYFWELLWMIQKTLKWTQAQPGVSHSGWGEREVKHARDGSPGSLKHHGLRRRHPSQRGCTSTNIRTIVSKLLFKLRDKWRSCACDLSDKQNKRAKFNDPVEFVEKQARISLDPVYGNIIYPVQKHSSLSANPGQGSKQSRAKAIQKLHPQVEKVVLTQQIHPS